MVSKEVKTFGTICALLGTMSFTTGLFVGEERRKEDIRLNPSHIEFVGLDKLNLQGYKPTRLNIDTRGYVVKVNILNNEAYVTDCKNNECKITGPAEYQIAEHYASDANVIPGKSDKDIREITLYLKR